MALTMRVTYPTRSWKPKKWHGRSKQEICITSFDLWRDSAIKIIVRPLLSHVLRKTQHLWHFFRGIPIPLPITTTYINKGHNPLCRPSTSGHGSVVSLNLNSIFTPWCTHRCIRSRLVSAPYLSSTPKSTCPIVPPKISSQARLSPSRKSWNHSAHPSLAKGPTENSNC